MTSRLIHQVSMKRQICSYDMVAVPSSSYTVTDAEGEMYLCNSRCLCIWAVMLVTKHNLPESETGHLWWLVPLAKSAALTN
jgi:hypothetical protein